MAALAAHVAVVSIATTVGGTYSVLSGAKSASMPRDTDMLDTTAFDDGADRTFIPGLRNGTLDLSGRYESADTAYGHIKDAFANQTSIFVKWLPNGTAGFRAEYYVQSLEISGEVEGLVEVSVSLQRTGATTDI
jgi:predicted secreted protein